jgi:hypothetical protein
MRGIKFVFLVAVAMAGLTLSTGVGASTGKGSAPAKASGAHIQKVIVNGSAQRLGKIPARVTRLLKKSVNNPNCPGADTSASGPTVQSCVWLPDYTGSITCIQSSNVATMTQICDASQIQTTGSKTNNALIVQVIISKNPPSNQDGTQIVKLRQTAVGTGGNNAGIGQYIKQSLGPGTPEDTEENELEASASSVPLIQQKQESHQIVHLRQLSASGANNALPLQFLRQRERAANGNPINQYQNTDDAMLCQTDESDGLGETVTVDPNANMCILLNQVSTSGGKQSATLAGDYNQFQRARNAGAGEQVQGNIQPFVGGEDYGLQTASSTPSTVKTFQNERQVQRAVAAAVTQTQNGPRKGSGSTQTGNDADQWTGSQTSTQLQTKRATPADVGTSAFLPGGTQFNILSYSGVSSGKINADQKVTQNNGTPVEGHCTNTHVCESHIVCSEGCEPVPCPSTQTPNESGVCECPPYTSWDPATQACTGTDLFALTWKHVLRR